MARQELPIGMEWGQVADGPAVITISKVGKGTLSLNTSASETAARVYGQADDMLNKQIDQPDAVSTFATASGIGWELVVARPGDGRFLDNPTGGAGAGQSGATLVQPSPYSKRLQNDAFGRQRVAIPRSVWDAKMTYQIPDDYDQLAENGATITHQPTLSGALLAVDAQAGSRAILQSAEYQYYQPGNGHEIKSTYGNIDLTGNCEFLVGYFDDENGVLFSYKNGGVRAILRSSVPGAPVDEVIPQSSWNIDKLDGSGPSGIVLDPVGRQIAAPDLEWLSVGTVQVGFYIDRDFVPVHAFNYANTPGAAYMTTADLPVRWELLGDGINTASVVAECGVVQTSGEQVPKGKPHTAENALTTVGATEVMLIALRLKTMFLGKANHVKVDLQDALGVSLTEVVSIKLLKNPTVTIAPGAWVDADADSAVEFATVGTALAAGTGHKMRIFPVAAASQGQGTPGVSRESLEAKEPFANRLDGSRDILVFTGRTLAAATSDVYLVVNWQENQ